MPRKSIRYNKEDPYVDCRYYRKENSIEIKCKGLCGTHTVNCFRSAEDKDEWKHNFCKGLYKGCPLYIGLAMDDEEGLD